MNHLRARGDATPASWLRGFNPWIRVGIVFGLPIAMLAWSVGRFGAGPTICGFGAISYLAVGAHAAVRSLQSRRWPSVSGVVETSELESFGMPLIRPKRFPWPYRQRGFREALTYRYAVAGNELLGHRAFFGDHFDLPWTVQRYWPGAVVTVYYDPKRSSRSVLRRSIARACICLGIGAAFSWLAVVVTSP